VTSSARLTLATDPGTPGWPNEDFAAVAPGAAVLLDGATTVPRSADTGCVHGVAWYARTLGTALLAGITAEPQVPLAAALAEAIAQVRDQHRGTCDLSSPITPAATVTDSSVAADYADGRPPLILSDRHQSAKASPDAARHATTGSLPREGLRGVALLSDGATRITDLYHLLAWPAVVDVIRDHGPAELVRQVRAAEERDQDCERWPRDKPRDDATIVYWHCG
jgi:hypothetical protein